MNMYQYPSTLKENTALNKLLKSRINKHITVELIL